jgi:non-ribosomal peptide synthetase component E (peptide arylation enzyme)
MKISPVELDIFLEMYPGLGEAAVCAYADDRLGEKICACVVPENKANAPTLEQLCEYLLQHGLAKFKLPEKIMVCENLPRNPLNKVQRFKLQEQLAQQLEN